MKHYKIISFVKFIGGIRHTYVIRRIGGQETGDYFCETLNDTKIESDFICEQSTVIDSIRCMDSQRTYALGTPTNQGSVTHIRLNKGRGEIRLGTENWIRIGVMAPAPIQPVIPQPQAVNTNNQEDMATRKAGTGKTAPKAVEKTTPSRSQIAAAKKEDPFKDIQTKIEKQADIRLEKFMKKGLPPTVKEFLVAFFTKYNNDRNTIYVSNKTVQTTTGRRRSMGDLFKICQYYYPEVTLLELVTLLFRELKNTPGLKGGFRYSYCTTVKRRVFYFSSGSGTLEENSVDEFGFKPEYYITKI